MNFSRYKLVLLITAGLTCLALNTGQAHGYDASGTSGSPPSSPESHGPLGGLINMFVPPLRATMEQARRLLGGRMDSSRRLVTDGLDAIHVNAFNIFMRIYNKTYSPEEIPRRMALFVQRRKAIEQSAKDFMNGRLSFMMRENPFIDWDESELRTLSGALPPTDFSSLAPEERDALINQETGGNEIEVEEPTVTRAANDLSADDDRTNLTVKATVRIPATLDWRTTGCVATPMDQKRCGACYAIATMSVVETMRCLKKVSSPILAPQQIVDCSTGYGNYGCDGGWPTKVLRYLGDVNLAAREACYPFIWRKYYCRLSEIRRQAGCTVDASPSGGSIRYKLLHNEDDILYHVATTGPVVTVMRATDKFLYYGQGIFDDPSCRNRRDDVDHAIVIVGYGMENGVDYWIIKNSWGTDWGQGGYGKYRRGKNACSIGHWGWVITS